MKLYSFWRSSAAYRVRIALNLKGIRAEFRYRSLRSGEHRQPEYLAVNPQGLIPALEVGGVTLSQSLAIIEYLDETHPAPPLLPTDPMGRAQVRAMAQIVACDIHPLNNLRTLQFLKSDLKQSERAVAGWYEHWIAEGFVALEELAKRWSADGRHLFGSSVSLADVCLVPQVYNARRFNCDLTHYPTLTAISGFLESMPPFAQATPEIQGDAEAG